MIHRANHTSRYFPELAHTLTEIEPSPAAGCDRWDERTKFHSLRCGISHKYRWYRAAIRRAHAEVAKAPPKRLEARWLAMGAALLTLQHPTLYRAFHRRRFPEGGAFTAEASLGVVERGPFYRYTMCDAQAHVVRAQLSRVDALIDERRALYAFYRRGLASATGFSLPPADEHSAWAPIRFPIRVRGDKLAFYREAARRGVDFAFSFTFIEAPATCTEAHARAREVLDLPFYSGLTEARRRHVVDTVLAVDRDLSRAEC